MGLPRVTVFAIYSVAGCFNFFKHKSLGLPPTCQRLHVLRLSQNVVKIEFRLVVVLKSL